MLYLLYYFDDPFVIISAWHIFFSYAVLPFCRSLTLDGATVTEAFVTQVMSEYRTQRRLTANLFLGQHASPSSSPSSTGRRVSWGCYPTTNALGFQPLAMCQHEFNGIIHPNGLFSSLSRNHELRRAQRARHSSHQRPSRNLLSQVRGSAGEL